MSEVVRNKLIAAGVRNLKEFGYPNVDAENILTDFVFAKFFARMLEESKGEGGEEYDRAIDEILALMESKK